jgi:hypothetical protein
VLALSRAAAKIASTSVRPRDSLLLRMLVFCFHKLDDSFGNTIRWNMPAREVTA